jgi:hypothetical protein
MIILRSMDRCQLPLQRSINATFDQLLTRARYGVDTGIRRPGNAVIAPALARIRGVGLQQDARLQYLTGRRLALLDQRVEILPFIARSSALSRTIYFFTAGCFAVTMHLPKSARPSIQKVTAESTTKSTSQ